MKKLTIGAGLLVLLNCGVAIRAAGPGTKAKGETGIEKGERVTPAAPTTQPATLTVNVDQPGVKVSPMLYGIFFEEINRAGDGGLYAEMVQNRSFEDGDKPAAWTLVKADGADATMAVDANHPLNERNPHSLRLEIAQTGGGRVGVANEGFKGMAIRKDAQYALSLYARAGEGFKGPLAVSLEGGDGGSLASAKIEGIGPDWQKHECILVAGGTDANARLVVSAASPGTLWLDMVSLFPKDTWKNRPNGLRADLAQMLADLKPAFVRFPGGCWVEGDKLATSYRWKDTIGDVAQRRNLWNLWRYYSTNGLGYHEYLQMCEDLGAEPLFVINCGMSHKENVPMDQMGQWVQDALDAIEYANGPESGKWGALRAKAGHPAPFGLKYMEIGNENGGPAYHERYALFHDAIKARYPDVRLVADVWGGTPKGRPIEIVDEHYYSSPEFFMHNAARYDKYDRGGPKVYVGEYAVTQGSGQGNLRAAVGEAAFMTGMERNSDVVVMASYAPLFANVRYKAWNPDLICFDASRAFGTPSYYVQQLFARNRADVVLPVEMQFPPVPAETKRGAVGVGTWSTQAEFKDFHVTQGDKVLLDSDFATGAEGWKTTRGAWKVEQGSFRQTGAESDVRAVTGDVNWSDYTIRLKARKTGGAEGFLILFHVRDEKNLAWWNLGGWGNVKHAIEVCSGGGKSILGSEAPGKIETWRWYDIRIETKGAAVRCYLDDKLVHDATYGQTAPLYAVAARAGDEVILKVVNVSARAQETQVHLRGAKKVSGGTEIVLTSARGEDENTLGEPKKVAPVARAMGDVAPSFRHTFPPNSVTVLRAKVSE